MTSSDNGAVTQDGARTLVTLLSQALIAFTVEADNDYEEEAPHRTTLDGGGTGPWLTSMACWTNGLRYVSDGVSVAELELRARTRPNVGGLLRWGYLRDDAGVLRLTAGGRVACERWALIPAQVESRWRDRFGPATIDRLRAALAAVAGDLKSDLPDGMPVLGFGLRSDQVLRAGPPPADLAERELPALLSRVLLALALAYEERAKVSLAVATTVLRVLDGPGAAVADLPTRSGVAKETVAVALAWLERHGLVAVGSGRRRMVEPTDAGRRARSAYLRRLHRADAVAADRWPGPVAEARAVLADILGSSRLADGLVPPANGWRSRPPYRRQTDAWLAGPADMLPRFPIVTHRGGWPDGN